MWTDKSNPIILKEIGERLKEYRLQQNITQSYLAWFTGISLNVVQRVESGRPVSTANFILILRGLGLLENLDMAFPVPSVSPIELARMKEHTKRLRASKEDKKR